MNRTIECVKHSCRGCVWCSKFVTLHTHIHTYKRAQASGMRFLSVCHHYKSYWWHIRIKYFQNDAVTSARLVALLAGLSCSIVIISGAEFVHNWPALWRDCRLNAAGAVCPDTSPTLSRLPSTYEPDNPLAVRVFYNRHTMKYTVRHKNDTNFTSIITFTFAFKVELQIKLAQIIT